MGEKRGCLIFFVILTLFTLLPVVSNSKNSTLEEIKNRGVLLWGADAEGGAPYIFPDPKNPNTYIGFEVDLAEAIAEELGVRLEQVQNNWDSLIPSLDKRDFDLVMNGIEITSNRKDAVLFSRPYFVYAQQLVTRKDEKDIKEIDDVHGARVGTLSASAAYNILSQMNDVEVLIYSGQVEPYEDLMLGRIDAVLMDLPISDYYALPNPKLKYAGEPFAEGYYAIAVRQSDVELRDELNKILDKLLENGTIEKIYRKWGLWNQGQRRLYDFLGGASSVTLADAKKVPAFAFFPALLKGAAITVGLSCVSMMLAIVLGMTLTLMRLYGNPAVKWISIAYVEIFRGTPLLIQLYILYYGLPNIGISLSPLVAAILGLGMNYASYEAEIYRAGFEAIPKGQMEAAVSLGMPKMLAIRRIIIPQAFRITIPAVTNDFISLFKDSSIVSVIAMVELTKTYSMLATTTLKFFELGLIVAFLYFAMSYPLSLFAQRLERKMKGCIK